MTLPNEEQHSLDITREFLSELIDSWGTSKQWTKREFVNRARQCFRHYPPKVRIDKLYNLERCYNKWTKGE